MILILSEMANKLRNKFINFSLDLESNGYQQFKSENILILTFFLNTNSILNLGIELKQLKGDVSKN